MCSQRWQIGVWCVGACVRCVCVCVWRSWRRSVVVEAGVVQPAQQAAVELACGRETGDFEKGKIKIEVVFLFQILRSHAHRPAPLQPAGQAAPRRHPPPPTSPRPPPRPHHTHTHTHTQRTPATTHTTPSYHRWLHTKRSRSIPACACPAPWVRDWANCC